MDSPTRPHSVLRFGAFELDEVAGELREDGKACRLPAQPFRVLVRAYQRVAVAADSGNGISAILDFARYSFLNLDLTINLLRKPIGEWICLDARTCLGPTGCGLAESMLYDLHGFIGRATQSLAIRVRD
jgi:hypothetical protein